MAKVMILGDTHGDKSAYLEALEHCIEQKIKHVFVVGDLGLFPAFSDTQDYIDGVHKVSRANGIVNWWVRGNHDCLKPNSRALTKNGFKYWHELSVGQEVLSVDDNNVECWVPIEKIIQGEYSGPMVNISAPALSTSMTPNHRLLYERPAYSKNYYRHTKGGEVLACDWKFLGAEFHIRSKAKAKDTSMCLTDNQIRLAAWCLTDSWIDRGLIWKFSQRESNVHKIEKILANEGLRFTKNIRHRDVQEICGKRVFSQEPEVVLSVTAEDSKKISFDHHTFDNEFWNMSDSQAEIFIAELVECDGSIHKHHGSRMIYCSDKNKDIFATFLTAKGYRASLNEYRKGHWRINISKREYIKVKSSDVKEEYYEGDIWCLKVPTGKFFVEDEGKVFLSGNSTGAWQATIDYWPGPHGSGKLRSSINLLPRTRRFRLFNLDFLVVGGAVSIDKDWRVNYEKTPKTLWWPDEAISDFDVDTVLQDDSRVDVLLSHECSDQTPFDKRLKPDLDSKICRQRLDTIIRASRPELHFHGHMHEKYEWDNYLLHGGSTSTRTYGLECNSDAMWHGGHSQYPPNNWTILDTETLNVVWRQDEDR